MKPRGAEHADSSSRPIAAMLPSSRQLHLAVTSKRLVAFGSGLISNKPTELQGEIQLSALKAIDVEKKKLGSRMVLHFSDGSTAEFDVHRSANTQAFVDAAKKRRRG